MFRRLATLERTSVLRHVVKPGQRSGAEDGPEPCGLPVSGERGCGHGGCGWPALAADILRVAAELTANPRDLVLGVRTFGRSVPLRSRLGNALTRAIMRAITGQKLSDTQTGLRGIPMEWIPEL